MKIVTKGKVMDLNEMKKLIADKEAEDILKTKDPKHWIAKLVIQDLDNMPDHQVKHLFAHYNLKETK